MNNAACDHCIMVKGIGVAGKYLGNAGLENGRSDVR